MFIPVNDFLQIGIVILSYLMGGIPFGYLVGKWVKGIDIRKSGSGNIGATNVARVIGKKWGVVVFILDFLKGVLPLFLAFSIKGCSPLVFLLVALGCVAGHNWSVFLKFKGGKGVSTSLGVITGLSFKFPQLIIPLSLALGGWIVIFFLFHYVSLASLISATVFCLFCIISSLPWEIKGFSLLILFFIIIRHTKNISNLLKNKELKV